MRSTHFAHHSYGSLPGRSGNFVLNQIEHVFIIQQTYQMEGAKAGRTAQGQISNHHRTANATRMSGEHKLGEILMQNYLKVFFGEQQIQNQKKTRQKLCK